MSKESELKTQKVEVEIEGQPDGSILLTTTEARRKETKEAFTNLGDAKEAKNLETGFWVSSTLGLAAVGVSSFLGGLVQLSKGIAEGNEVQSLGSTIAIIGGATIISLANKVGNKAELLMYQADRVNETMGGEKEASSRTLTQSHTSEEKREE